MSNHLHAGTSLLHPTQVQNDIDHGGDDEVQENSEDDDSEESDDVLQ